LAADGRALWLLGLYCKRKCFLHFLVFKKWKKKGLCREEKKETHTQE
jgi:hypothetical protein